MRMILVAMLLVASAAAFADGRRDRAATNDNAIGAPEVMAALYQFDLFEQNAIDSADTHGNQQVRNFAIARADDAAKRDKILDEIRKQTGANVSFDRKSSPARGDTIPALVSDDGPVFVRKFYQAQVVEHRSAVDALERYLQAPGNDELRSFAADELPVLRAGLEDSEAAMTDE
jgi:predicted outer membrane protein